MNNLFSLILFVVLMVGSPGPANLLLIAAGSKYGYLKNLPFIIGLIGGKALLGIAIGFGIGTFLLQNPTLNLIFKIISAGYIIYLASLSFKSKKNETSEVGKLSEYSFIKGLMVHPLNPKAWTTMVLAYSEYSAQLEGLFVQIAIIGLIFALVQLVFHSFYCLAGAMAGVWLGKNQWLNKVLAIITIVVVLYVILV